MSGSPNSPRSSEKTTPSPSASCPTRTPARRDDGALERRIEALLANGSPDGTDDRDGQADEAGRDANPAIEVLAELWECYRGQLAQLEKLTAISDGFQSAMRADNQSVTERYRQQIRRLQKIVRISDRYQQIQQEMNQALLIASTHDPLTELPNRRLMLDRLKAEAALSSRQGYTFTLALMDVDHFKRVNDRFGHAAGDSVLVAVARVLRDGFRAYDVCSRWGGEEFLVLLPGTPGQEAVGAVSRMCAQVTELEPPELPFPVNLTLSVGLAEHRTGTDLDETIKRADRALYRAKRAGRNRVMLEE